MEEKKQSCLSLVRERVVESNDLLEKVLTKLDQIQEQQKKHEEQLLILFKQNNEPQPATIKKIAKSKPIPIGNK